VRRTALLLLPPDERRALWIVDQRRLREAIERLGLRLPIRIRRQPARERYRDSYWFGPWGAKGDYVRDQHGDVINGHDILLRSRPWYAPETEEELEEFCETVSERLAHELVHARQLEQHSSPQAFLDAYNDEFAQWGYFENHFETEADDYCFFNEEWALSLCRPRAWLKTTRAAT
jgi:hypothetical protein